eukprot:4618285-Heterocapsa_arctica.AAC.1
MRDHGRGEEKGREIQTAKKTARKLHERNFRGWGDDRLPRGIRRDDRGRQQSLGETDRSASELHRTIG